jgi:hypothetical protein
MLKRIGVPQPLNPEPAYAGARSVAPGVSPGSWGCSESRVFPTAEAPEAVNWQQCRRHSREIPTTKALTLSFAERCSMPDKSVQPALRLRPPPNSPVAMAAGRRLGPWTGSVRSKSAIAQRIFAERENHRSTRRFLREVPEASDRSNWTAPTVLVLGTEGA